MKSFNNWIQRLREQESEVPYSGDWAIPQNTSRMTAQKAIENLNYHGDINIK